MTNLDSSNRRDGIAEKRPKRVVIQNEDQTEGIIVDLATAPVRKLSPPLGSPLIQIYYLYNTRSTITMDILEEIRQTGFPPSTPSSLTGAYQINVESPLVISVLKALLDDNAQQLATLKKTDVHEADVVYNGTHFKRSFIVPLPKPTDTQSSCSFCSRPAHLTCSRCTEKV